MFTTIIRIYYEDTDAGGVVYYANYLKFAERARTEMLRSLGIEQRKLLEEQGIAFVVRRAALDLRSPARLDDEITIETTINQIKPASLLMTQTISCAENKLCEIQVKIACINKAFKPCPLPKEMLEIFKNLA